VALDQDPGAEPHEGDGGGEVERLAGHPIRGPADLGDDRLGRLPEAAAAAGQGDGRPHELQEAAPVDTPAEAACLAVAGADEAGPLLETLPDLTWRHAHGVTDGTSSSRSGCGRRRGAGAGPRGPAARPGAPTRGRRCGTWGVRTFRGRDGTRGTIPSASRTRATTGSSGPLARGS